MPRSRRLLVANLLAQPAFGLLAMTISIPSMQDWSAEFGAPQARVQLTLSACVVAYCALQLLHGPLSDRLAREPAFLLCVAILAMTTAIFYAFLAGAPVVLGSHGVGPDGIGLHILCIPLACIGGHYLTSRLAHRVAERPMMALGQCLTPGGLALVLVLAGVNTPLAAACWRSGRCTGAGLD
jgi:MFS family permease